MDEREFNKLLAQIKTSERALKKMYDFYFYKIVYHVGKKYGKTFAEDVAQEFFLKLLRSENVVCHVQKPTTWVYLQCDSIAKRKVASENKYAYMEIGLIESVGNIIPTEEYSDLYAAMESLTDIEKKIVELYYWEGYSLKELAPMVGIDYAAVRQRHKRLISKLKKLLPIG
ncbi:MAG: sigma-70 family RNA polymerase sigma factor [Clostridia bacterium]|nr:sigma-70 family RNA polymerase sigma factor [Clostridia bacterium]